MSRLYPLLLLVPLLALTTSYARAQERRADPTTIWPSDQDEGRLRPGARVRVTLKPIPDHPEPRRVLGLLMSVDDVSIVINERPGSEATTLPLAFVQKFEVSQGRQAKTGKGALIGGASGVAAGVAAGLIVCADGDCVTSGEGDLKGTVATVLGVGGGLFGVGVGCLVGSHLHSERWRVIPRSDLRMNFVPTRDGVRLGLSLSFR